MLALHWPFGLWPLDPLPLRRRSRRTPVTLGIGRYRHSSLLAREGARNHTINRAIQRSTKEPVPSLRVGAAQAPSPPFERPRQKGARIAPISQDGARILAADEMAPGLSLSS